jgi:hypothetical protein
MRGAYFRWIVYLVCVMASGPKASAEVVLLKNGGLFEGHLQREPNRIAVLLRDGARIELDLSRVDYVGADATSAFEFQRNRLSPDDVQGQVRLFHWAVRNRLPNRAATILAQLRSAYPHRSDLESLEKLLHGRESSGLARIESRPVPAPDRVVPVAPETLQRFADRIQPLLINRCANAGCHGFWGESDFLLRTAGTRAREPRQLTLANMRASLAFVNQDDPPSSPLLVQSLQPHGTTEHVPLGKIDQQAAYQALLDWVVMAARDQGGGGGTPSLDTFSGQVALPADEHPAASSGELEALEADAFNQPLVDAKHVAGESDPPAGPGFEGGGDQATVSGGAPLGPNDRRLGTDE